MTELTPLDTLQRLSEVQKALAEKGISKSERNKQQGYQYRGIDGVMNALSPLLAEQGLIIFPCVVGHHMDIRTTGNNKNMYHHRVEVDYFIYGPKSEKPLGPFRSNGECLDTSDKGLNKACTAAYKYWVLTTFCIPTEGHEDADATTPEETSQPGNIPTVYLSDDERHEILGLCMQTNTNVDQFVAWLGYPKLIEVPGSEYARAIQALNSKLSHQSKEYAGEQAATAQSMNGGQ